MASMISEKCSEPSSDPKNITTPILNLLKFSNVHINKYLVQYLPSIEYNNEKQNREYTHDTWKHENYHIQIIL